LTTTALPALTGAWGTGFQQGFHLIGRQDLGQLVLGFFFQISDLLFLVVGQIHFLLGKARDEMKASLRLATLTTAASSAAATTTLLTDALLTGTGRTPVVVGMHKCNRHATGKNTAR
jgi:hypothetical protein